MLAATLGLDLQGASDKAVEWVVLNGADLAVRVISALVILLVGKIVISLVAAAVQKQLNRQDRVSDLMEDFMVNMIRRIGWIVVLMIAIKQLGVDIGPLIAGLGVGGFIIGFAFQETLGNLASGFMIALNQPFTLGDFVDLNGHLGVVAETNMMATTLTTVDNKKIVIPNKNVWGSAIVNYTALDERRVDMVVGVSYGADLNQTKDVIVDTLKGIDKILEEPAAVVEVTEMADSSVNFVVRPWCKTPDYWAVYFEANKRIKEALDEAGIEIPFPQMDVHHIGNAPLPQE